MRFVKFLTLIENFKTIKGKQSEDLIEHMNCKIRKFLYWLFVIKSKNLFKIIMDLSTNQNILSEEIMNTSPINL